MALVIAGGKSVEQYDRLHLSNLCRCGYTIAVNTSAFKYPHDLVVALDPDVIVKYYSAYVELGKPIVTRDWDMLKDYPDLKYIKIPHALGVRYKYSGNVAIKLADALAIYSMGRHSYFVGIDGGKGHYKGYLEGQDNTFEYDYNTLNITHSYNLGGAKSKIATWPKKYKLPKVHDVIVHDLYREVATKMITDHAVEILEDKLWQ